MLGKARKKTFGSGQLIFENWSGGRVDFFSCFFEPQHKSSKSYFQVLKLEIQIKPGYECHVEKVD